MRLDKSDKELDSIPSFNLKEVVLYADPKFDSNAEFRKYLILKKKVLKVYPYAKLVSDRVKKMEKRLEKIKSPKARNKYVEIVREYFQSKLVEDLKNMTQTEGQILCKLIFRESGSTVYDIVSKFKGDITAFLWNSTIYVFNISLKKEYDPSSDSEDTMIEFILKKAFAENYFDNVSIIDDRVIIQK
ncbi:hypothetical protein JBKA6_0978 [Ichthyobacterium seriolicida]|uniref:DUF4294 domain-containing protein n=1 Tax=Ichthyobacterium seriolicida TaxID=242600 RepID=A0A1J1DYK9_9FLAO|nr:hypothetical protein JBKA6_0978 [Ichthyobacterium seriolicida]